MMRIYLLKYIGKRLLVLTVILFGLTLLTFSLTFILPSDPVQQLIESMGGTRDAAVVQKLQKQYGLDKSFKDQYLSWLLGILRGDFGDSVKYGQPVAVILGRKLPNTVKLACSSFVLMLIFAVPLGILSAVYHNRAADYAIRALSFIGMSLPGFWVGLILIYFLSVKAHWLPVSGSESVAHLIMPTITLATGMASIYIRRIRTAMMEQMHEPYIIGERSRGVSRIRIIFAHILPNSLLSIITMLGMSFGGLLGGTMIVEMLFSWNGVGKAAVDAIANRDYQLIQGYVIWMGIIYVMVNLLVDISYQYLDPRIRAGAQKC
jgi:peptide/nickel transport system permease protein